MKSKLCSLAVLSGALLVGHEVLAQDFNWNGAGDGKTWSNGANWLQASPPTNGAHAVFIGTGYPTTSTQPITVGPSDVMQITDSFFGPEWGQTLNVNGGTLFAAFGVFPLGDNFTGKSVINVRSNAVFSAGDTISLGDTWWFAGGPNVVMNVFDTSQVASKYFWVGGHLNLYGGSVTVTNFMGTGPANGPVFTGGIDSDITRRINLVNGKLVLPTGSTAAVQDWISRGIFVAYGKVFATNEIVITDDGNNTIVTNVPLGGALQSTFIQPLAPSTLVVGTSQQAKLLGNYPNVTNVLLSTSEPGVEPSTLPGAVIFSSGNPSVFTVSSDGAITAVGPGTATLKAVMGTFTNTLNVTVQPSNPTLIHRYSFNETSGTVAGDSVGGASWNGTLNGTASFSGSGELVLDGSTGAAVQLPAGVVSNLSALTVEAWATFPSTIASYAVLFGFGEQNQIAFDPNQGNGGNYVMLSPHTGTTNVQANFGIGLPGFNNERDAVWAGQVLDNQANVHIAAVYNPLAGTVRLYINSTNVATYNDPAYFLFMQNSRPNPLANVLGADPLNYIGQSLYQTDPGLLANINEFRIYNGALSDAQVRADYLLGANQLIGTNAIVSLNTLLSGNSVVVTWPTNSALVNVQTTSSLGAGAPWTAAPGSMTLSGTNYQMVIPTSASTAFFRLLK